MGARRYAHACLVLVAAVTLGASLGCSPDGSPDPATTSSQTQRENTMASESRRLSEEYESSGYGYRGAIALVPCEELTRIIADLLEGMDLLPPLPPYPGDEDVVDSCRWQAPDKSRSAIVAIAKFVLAPGDMELLRAGRYGMYIGDQPSYKVQRTPRLDAIGAVAIQPQNGPSTFVHLPAVRVNTVGLPSYELSLESSTRIAEYISDHNL